MELKSKKIVFLGDSITEGACTSGVGYRYWEILASRTGAVCLADGRGGSCIARQQHPEKHDCWNGNIRHHFVSRVDSLDGDADVVVVFGGSNDFGFGDALFGTMTDRTEDTFYGALHQLYSSLIERYPQGRIIVMTPLHFIEENSFTRSIQFDGVKREHLLIDYVQAIRQVAEYYALPVLDLYAVSGLQPSVQAIRERYMPDGLHPNDAGQKRIAECLENFLRAL